MEGATGRVIGGTPGERWRNNTEETYYQLRVTFANSCAYCIARASLIARRWKLPFHNHCACTLFPIGPSYASKPFIDVMRRVAGLSRAKRRRVMGAGLYRLVESGAVDFADTGEGGRPLSLREVVRRRGITRDVMRKAGVPEPLIGQVWRDVGPEVMHGPPAVRAKARRERDAAEQARFEAALARLRPIVQAAVAPASARPGQPRFVRALRKLRAKVMEMQP